MASGTFNVSFDTTAFFNLAKRLQNGPKRVQEYINSRIKFLALGMERRVVAATPKRTSALAGSTKAVQLGDAKWKIVQTATAKNRWRPGYLYGRGLRLGTRRHAIAPPHPHKRFLYWTGIKTGKPIAMVMHPGQKPIRYHVQALSQSRPLITTVAKKIGSTGALRYLGKVGT